MNDKKAKKCRKNKKSSTSVDLEETIITGGEMYRNGCEVHANPYPSTDLRATAWLTGWYAGKLHLEGALAREQNLDCDENPYAPKTSFPGLESTTFDARTEWEYGWINHTKFSPRKEKITWLPAGRVLSFSA
jgi:ribosome modulation factor